MAEACSMLVPLEPANYYNQASMRQSLQFSDSLKDLKNLKQQLYSAAEYFEFSYANDDQKHVAVNTLKEYTVKALVNTVDHLGSMCSKLNGALESNFDSLSRAELRISCIQQRLQTCRNYVDHEGISEQSLVIDAPKFYKRYILPSGETMHGGVKAKLKFQGCVVEDEDDWHHFRNAIRATLQECPVPVPEISKGLHSRLAQSEGSLSFPSNKFINESERRRDASAHRSPVLQSESLSIAPSTPKTSRSNTPNKSRPTTPTSASHDQQLVISAPQKALSMQIRAAKESRKDGANVPGMSRRLLKALLSRHRSKKDDTLYTYLDEY